MPSFETLGDAWVHGWRLLAYCTRGQVRSPAKPEKCGYEEELDLSTLLWTRGKAFPISRIGTRLKCPRCGSRDIRVIFVPAREEQSVRALR